MAHEDDDFDPEASTQSAIGREMVDDSTGVGSVVAHMYRGEVEREVSWRGRLDSTTNWAVTIISAILAYTFSSEDVSHAIVLAGMVIGGVFLFIESSRFRRYDIWRSRVRSMQENLFANALDPSAGVEQRDWRRQLSEDYRRPTTKLSRRKALAHRLRRVYLPLLVGLLIVWLVRLGGDSDPLVEAATVSGVPGSVVVGTVTVGYVCLFTVALSAEAESLTETGEDVDHGDLGRE